jgi:hypothetical protein
MAYRKTRQDAIDLNLERMHDYIENLILDGKDLQVVLKGIKKNPTKTRLLNLDRIVREINEDAVGFKVARNVVYYMQDIIYADK